MQQWRLHMPNKEIFYFNMLFYRYSKRHIKTGDILVSWKLYLIHNFMRNYASIIPQIV